MRLVLPVLAAVLSSCVPTPESYPVPPQHREVSAPPILGYGDYVEANDPAAEAHFVKDLKGLEMGKWRWAMAEPELRFSLLGTERLKFRIEFGVHPVILKDTGPLRFTIFINDHPLSTETFDSPGDRVFEKPVPAELLVRGLNTVRIKVHNPWRAPDSGVFLSFIFHGAGFLH